MSNVDPAPSTTKMLQSSNVNEESDCYGMITYTDVSGNSYTPSSVQWRLWDDTNQVLLQDWVSITPGPSNTVMVQAGQNTLGNSGNLTETRIIIFNVTAPGGISRYDELIYNLLALPDTP